MRALVIAPQPFFSPRGTPFSVYYRTQVLAQLGVDIDLLTYGQGQDVDLPRVRIIRIPGFRFLGPVKVGPSLFKLFLDVFLFIWTVALLIRHRYDFVHTHEESVFWGRLLKPLFGYKLVYDMHSSLPQQLTNFNYTSSRIVKSLFEWLEDRCLADADAVITICPELARYARARVCDERRHFLIENSIIEEVRLVNGSNPATVAESWAARVPAGRPIIAYAGTFEAYQGIDLLLAATALARRTLPEAFLLLIGGTSSQLRHYRRLAEQSGINGHCLFTGPLPQPAVRPLLRGADVLASPRSEGTNTPLKIYEQLASGKPLVATRILSHTQILDDRVSFLAEPEPVALAEALIAAISDGERRHRVVAAAQSMYERSYSRSAYEAKVSALLETLR